MSQNKDAEKTFTASHEENQFVVGTLAQQLAPQVQDLQERVLKRIDVFRSNALALKKQVAPQFQGIGRQGGLIDALLGQPMQTQKQKEQKTPPQMIEGIVSRDMGGVIQSNPVLKFEREQPGRIAPRGKDQFTVSIID